jgi:two-component system LytT family response regulator
MKVRAIVVEDEPIARATLRDYLRDVGWMEVVGDAADGPSAVECIDTLKPDLAFLDIELPELSGLGVLEHVCHKPAVIFTTAYDRYAVSAFEVQALDYLLKPFGRDRCLAAVERARERLGAPGETDVVGRLRDAVGGAALQRLFVRDRGGLVPVNVGDIARIEADDDYAALYVGPRRYLVHVTMNELERRLDETRFLRVHRRHIVNLDFVTAIRPADGVRLTVEMRDGARIRASRTRSKALRELGV